MALSLDDPLKGRASLAQALVLDSKAPTSRDFFVSSHFDQTQTFFAATYATVALLARFGGLERLRADQTDSLLRFSITETVSSHAYCSYT